MSLPATDRPHHIYSCLYLGGLGLREILAHYFKLNGNMGSSSIYSESLSHELLIREHASPLITELN